MNTDKLEINAIVELFGHTKMAGKVTEQTVGSSTFIRVDVPETDQQPAFTRIVNPSSIYALNPVSEEVMLTMAERVQNAPIQSWDVKKLTDRLLALKEQNSQFDEAEEEEEFPM